MALAVVSVLCPPVLSQVFGSKKNIISISSGASAIIKTLVEGSMVDVKTAVMRPNFSLYVTQMQHLDLPREVRRGCNKQLVFCMGESQAAAFIMMKDNMNMETAQMIIRDFTNSDTMLEKLADSVEDLKTVIKKRYHEAKCVVTFKDLSCGLFNTERTCIHCTEGPKPTSDGFEPYLTRYGKVVLSYLDVTKDTALAIKLISLIGVQIFTEPALFQSVIIWLLIASIIVPLLKSAVETAVWYPHTVLDSSVNPPRGCKLRALQVTVFSGYFFVPSLLIINKEKAELKRKMLLEKSKDQFLSAGVVKEHISEELREVEKYGIDVTEAYLIFKKNEASFEIFLQMGLQLTMLLLSMTTFPTHAGLQGVFRRDYTKEENILRAHFGAENESFDFGEWLLIGSIIWSFKTVSTTFIWIKTARKSHIMGVAAKSVLGLRAFLCSTSRIFAVVAFFGPFLGLLDCLAHWKAQQKPLDPELLERLVNNSYSYWDRATVQSLYKTLSLSEFTEYTVISLRTAVFLLIGSSLLFGLLLILLKRRLSEDFKAASWGGQLQHVAEVLNFPDAFLDWDDGSGNSSKSQ